MADPITVIGALAGLSQLADYGDTFARSLYKFIRHAPFAKQDIGRFRTQVQSFSQMVRASVLSLKRYCHDHEESPVLAYISDNKVVDGIVAESNWVQQSLKAAKDQVWDLRKGTSTWWMRIKWLLKRESILGLYSEMESVKNSLTLLITLTQLEVSKTALKKPNMDPDERDRLLSDIDEQKKVIKTSLQIIKVLAVQLKQSNRRAWMSRSRVSSVYSIGLDGRDALLELSRSMALDGTVPQTREPSEWGDSSSTSLTGSDQPSGGSHSSTVPLPASCASLPGKSPEKNTKGSGKARLDSPIPRRNNDLDIMYNVDCTIPDSTSISGYVRPSGASGNQFHYVGAILARNVNVNIITISLAVRLGLVVEPMADRSKVCVKFGDGKVVQIVGRVEFEWSRRSDNGLNSVYPPLSVICEVCEVFKSEYLVLGKPFIQDMGRHWPRQNVFLWE